MQQLAPSPSQPECPSYELVSLWDMYRFEADHMMNLARNLRSLEMFIDAPSQDPSMATVDRMDKHETVLSHILSLKSACAKAGLQNSVNLLAIYSEHPPVNAEAIRVLYMAVITEMKGVIYLRCPADRMQYWENSEITCERARTAFPLASAEIMSSGTAFAYGMNLASVFHAMRAAEIGLRALAADLSVTFPHGDLSLEQWQTLIDSIESKIRDMKNDKKSTQKSQNLKFYSQAAAQFRYFKDGFRVRVAHVFDPVSQNQALSILRQTADFFDILSERLTEPSP